MADQAKPRTSVRIHADLQHVEEMHPDGSVEEAAILFTANDPRRTARNVLVRFSTDDDMLRKWVGERPGEWTITLTPPKAP